MEQLNIVGKRSGAEVLMTYTIPMPPKQLSQETLVVSPIVHYGGPWGTVPELLFEKKGLIPALQQLLISSGRFVRYCSY